ncbi:MAG: hypothetical protein JW894_11725 [Bacteroidales bacterium]|nr:hypothetical protein [Bacteroidales bacterium]
MMGRTFKKHTKEDKIRRVKTDNKKAKGSFRSKAKSGLIEEDEYYEE